MAALAPLANGARTQRANAVSADGKVVVGVGAHTSFFAFRWTQSGGTRDLGTFDPLNPGSSASAVSADGNVVVGMGSGVDADSNGEAFVWFPARGMLDLRKYLLAHGVAEMQAWRLSDATGVSDDGRTLCGLGVDPQGLRAAWIAHIDIDDVVTEPPPTQVPASPTNLSAAATAKQVTLQWTDNANNETGFRIDRCQGNNCANFLQIAMVNANARTYIDTGTSRNMIYRYRVRAFNTAGNSAYSNIANVQTPKR
jgi:probable HAF family extracellular repeat protein